MKKSIIAATVAFALMATPAFAQSYHFESANIVVNDSTALSNVTKFVANKTTYMSVYDVQLLINKLLGITNKVSDNWRGDIHYWNITDTNATPKYISGSAGNTVFKINNQVVMNAPVIVTKPPGAKQETSFVPIWYVQQVINELTHANKYSDVWNGSVSPAKWTLTTINPGGPMIPAQGSSSGTSGGSGQTTTSSGGNSLTFKTHDGGTGSSKGSGTTYGGGTVTIG